MSSSSTRGVKHPWEEDLFNHPWEHPKYKKSKAKTGDDEVGEQGDEELQGALACSFWDPEDANEVEYSGILLDVEVDPAVAQENLLSYLTQPPT
eukprot:1218970-Amphidinium_carterae.1